MSTISQMLQSTLFPQLQLIAGENGIYRRVNGINIVEKEELTMFCRPNELVVTTGVLMANELHSLEQLVQQTFDKRTAGLLLIQVPIYKQSLTKSFSLQMSMSIRCSKWLGSTE